MRGESQVPPSPLPVHLVGAQTDAAVGPCENDQDRSLSPHLEIVRPQGSILWRTVVQYTPRHMRRSTSDSLSGLISSDLSHVFTGMAAVPIGASPTRPANVSPVIRMAASCGQ